MRLYKRADSKVWWMDYTVPGRKRVQKSTQRLLKEKAAAQRYMIECYQKDMNAAQFGDRKEVTFQEVLDVVISQKKESTGITYTYMYGLIIKYIDTNQTSAKNSRMLISSLSTKNVTTLRMNLLKEGYSNNSIHLCIKVLKILYNVARDDLEAAVNASVKFKNVKPFANSGYLSLDQEKAILDIIQDTENQGYALYDIFILLIDSGMRVGELSILRWNNSNLNKGIYNIHRPKTSTNSLVPISDRALRLLKNRMEAGHEFPYEITATHRCKLNKIITEVCNQDTLEVQQRGKMTIRTLRDTFVTRMLLKGMTITAVSEIVGHSSISMTAKYGHLESGDVVDQSRKILNDNN